MCKMVALPISIYTLGLIEWALICHWGFQLCMQLVLFQFIFGVDVLIFPNIFRQVPPRGRLSELYLKSGFCWTLGTFPGKYIPWNITVVNVFLGIYQNLKNSFLSKSSEELLVAILLEFRWNLLKISFNF